MKFSEIQHSLKGQIIGPDISFQSVSIDSRTIQPGELFIAIKGPNFDGHDYINDIQKKGAIGALVSRDIHTGLPLLKVADTHAALGALSKIRRDSINIPMIAVTGSCGKTTTKSMLGSILALQGETLVTQGTLNNDIGLPLTLLRLSEKHEFAVLELGANHPGEIAYVAQLARPTVAVITQAAPVHLEGFGDIQGVAKAKGEIYENLNSQGNAVINSDDPFCDFWKTLAKDHRVITFGIKNKADVWASHIKINENNCASFMLHTPRGEIDIHLSVLGEHNVMNALAAAAAVQSLNISLEKIKQGLENTAAVTKRLVNKSGLNGAKIIDDTYNANPLAFEAALKILQREHGKKILVMSDMGELGELAAHYHEQLGHQVREMGIDMLYATGKWSRLTAQAFGKTARYFETQEELVADVRKMLGTNTVVLVKGSRSMRMENVVEKLIS